MLKDDGHPNLIQVMHEMSTEIKELAESDIEEHDDLHPNFDQPKPHPKANIETRTKFTSQKTMNQLGSDDSDGIEETARKYGSIPREPE